MSYTGTDAWGQGSSGLEETRGETALGEPGTEPGDDSLSIKVQVSDNGNAMSTETNKALVRRWVEEVVNTPENLAAVDVLFAPDYVDYTNPPDWPPGRQGHKQIVALYHAAFPDFHYTIEHEVAEGDLVVVRGTYHLTHTGEEFFGIASTGTHVTTTGMHLFRVADKKIVEHWCNNDDLGVMRQLGVVS